MPRPKPSLVLREHAPDLHQCLVHLLQGEHVRGVTEAAGHRTVARVAEPVVQHLLGLAEQRVCPRCIPRAT
jgi:hypothetical protein